ncbi:TonB-dependent receptor [Alteromonas sp. RKMC-009]|uniref:TonB-dependent receptor n=1 Tax=Alteromonas sp. RKMC-009 TaxID=2267264 RepID=UPI000E6A91F4|nr:TonB-dependent receptor [Alteromonas sp. RKMC-009]AYA62807.1 TonB-dependent receptor [Alteromonas sp. RKMC-009]
MNYALPKKTLIASALLCALNPVAFAQETATPDEDQIERIDVTYRSSLVQAAAIKRDETKVADIITSEDIGKFPTENIAEAIQRIPGVQISNINGRGSTISVRGLGAQYARTTVNGQTMANADFTGGFRYDIIQSELASAISVIKSPSADMDTGGLSGTINIDTTKPLSYGERKIVASVKGQYSEFSPTDDVTPKGNITYIDQFADDTVGIFLNAGYQELDDRVDNFWMGRWFQDDEGNDYPRRPRYRRIDRETKRYLMNGAVQWRPTDSFETTFTAIYADDDTYQDLNQQVFLFDRDDITLLGDPVGGVYTNVRIDDFTLENNRQIEEKGATSKAFTLQSKYETENWIISGVAHYTAGDATESEEAAILATTVSATMDISDSSNVIFDVDEDLTDPALYPYDMPRNEYPNGATRIVDTSEKALQFDAERILDGDIFTSFAFGVKYRQEEFNREVYRTDRFAIGDADPADLPLMSEYNFMVTDFLDNQMSIQHAWIAPDIQAYRDALVAEGVTIPTFFAAQSSYGIERDILSFYSELEFDTMLGDFPFRGNFGGRYETTDRTINTYLTGEQNPDNEEIRMVVGEYDIDYDYTNFLPSMNLVLELTDEVQARFAAAKVLVRPILTSNTQIAASETSASNSFGTTTYTIDLGQPEMKAMTADQADLGLEWYYGEGDSLALTLFWKEIKNGSVTEFVCPDSYDGVALSGTAADCTDNEGNIYEITSTYNDDSGTTIKGYELGWNQGLDEWLPIKGFGFSANYTFIDAEDGEDFVLTNSSEETWNFIGYWENEVFSARVALNHRSPYIQDSNDAFFAREGRVVDGRDQIDVVLSYNVTEELNLRFGALNINGNDEEAYYTDEKPVWQTTSVLGTSYYLSAMYSF